MLHLYATGTVNINLLNLDTLTFPYFNRKWFNMPEAVYCIEKLDGNKYIGDGVSDSPWLGIIPYQCLSGGTKALVFAMANPNILVPLDYCGDNCAPIIEEISKTKDLSLVYASSEFMFTDTIEIHCMEYDEVVIGDKGYDKYLLKHNLSKAAYYPYQLEEGELVL